MPAVAKAALEKTVKVFYFDRETGTTRDISDLDPAREENGEAGWGGLAEFSGRVNAVVAHAVANADGGASRELQRRSRKHPRRRQRLRNGLHALRRADSAGVRAETPPC